MDNENFIQILTETTERAKSNTHQISELKDEVREIKKEQKAIYDIASSVKIMSESMANIKEDVIAVKESQEQFSQKVKEDIEEVKESQKELTNKIDNIEQKPYKNWNKLKSTIIGGVATAVGTGAIIYLINYLFNTNI